VVQISTFLFYALFLSFLWFIVPRMLWPHRYQPDDAVDRRIEADTPARYRPNRRPIEDPSVTVGEGTLEIPDVHYDRGAQPARTGRSPSAPEDPGLTRIFEEESPEQLASEAKSTRVSTSPGAPTTTFGEGVRAPAGAEDPSISKIFKTEEARNELRHSSRNDMEGLETVTLPPPNLQKPPQPPMKEPAADVGNLKNRLDEPRWPEQSLDSTGPVVMHRRTIDSGPGEHPVVIAGRRTKVSPTESIVPAQPAKNVGAVPPAPPEPARKALDPRFVLLLVLNLTFLLVAGVLLYFSLRR
jgi:hypothetical protein